MFWKKKAMNIINEQTKKYINSETKIMCKKRKRMILYELKMNKLVKMEAREGT